MDLDILRVRHTDLKCMVISAILQLASGMSQGKALLFS